MDDLSWLERVLEAHEDDALTAWQWCQQADRRWIIARYGYPKDNAFLGPLAQRMALPEYAALLLRVLAEESEEFEEFEEIDANDANDQAPSAAQRLARLARQALRRPS